MGWAPKLNGLCGAAARPGLKGTALVYKMNRIGIRRLRTIGKTELHEQGDRYEIRR